MVPDHSLSQQDKLVIGWREWVGLPDLGIGFIKAKIDTGARSSSLHAYDVEHFRQRGQDYVRFRVHPIQRDTATVIAAIAPVLDYRSIRSSSGESADRPVILTTIRMLGDAWPIELTLANRDQMGFRMLVGRQGIRGRMVVDPGSSYYGEQPPRKPKRTKKPKKGGGRSHPGSRKR